MCGMQQDPSSSLPAQGQGQGGGLKGGPHVNGGAGRQRAGCAACCSDALLVATLLGVSRNQNYTCMALKGRA